MNLRKKGGAVIAVSFDDPTPFTLAESTEVSLEVVAVGGVTMTDRLFYPMIVSALVDNPTFDREDAASHPIVVVGHDKVDVVFGRKDYYLV